MRTARRFLGLFAGERDDAAAAADDGVALFAAAVRVVLLAPAGVDVLSANGAVADQAAVAAHVEAAADAVEAGFAVRFVKGGGGGGGDGCGRCRSRARGVLCEYGRAGCRADSSALFPRDFFGTALGFGPEAGAFGFGFLCGLFGGEALGALSFGGLSRQFGVELCGFCAALCLGLARGLFGDKAAFGFLARKAGLALGFDLALQVGGCLVGRITVDGDRRCCQRDLRRALGFFDLAAGNGFGLLLFGGFGGALFGVAAVVAFGRGDGRR